MSDWNGVNRVTEFWPIEDEVDLRQSESDVFEHYIGDVHLRITRAQINRYDTLREIRSRLWPMINELMDEGLNHIDACAAAQREIAQLEDVCRQQVEAEITRLHNVLQSTQENRQRMLARKQ